MTKSRLEAFSDGVLAIVITIMVLEIKVPHGSDWDSLVPLWPIFLSYVLSFIYLGIYWNNHHHLFQAVKTVRGGVLWANLHLLFWLSLVPFTTGFMGENGASQVAVLLYGVNLLLAGGAYKILVNSLLKHHEHDSALRRAIGDDRKGNASLVLYLLGIAASYWIPAVSIGLYIVVAIIWLIPDARIERVLES